MALALHKPAPEGWETVYTTVAFTLGRDGNGLIRLDLEYDGEMFDFHGCDKTMLGMVQQACKDAGALPEVFSVTRPARTTEVR